MYLKTNSSRASKRNVNCVVMRNLKLVRFDIEAHEFLLDFTQAVQSNGQDGAERHGKRLAAGAAHGC